MNYEYLNHCDFSYQYCVLFHKVFVYASISCLQYLLASYVIEPPLIQHYQNQRGFHILAFGSSLITKTVHKSVLKELSLNLK